MPSEQDRRRYQRLVYEIEYHSPKAGTYDFTGIRDPDKFLSLAGQAGLYVIVQPGPYINAETDRGGFPGWLTTIKGSPHDGVLPEWHAITSTRKVISC